MSLEFSLFNPVELIKKRKLWISLVINELLMRILDCSSLFTNIETQFDKGNDCRQPAACSFCKH